jgi:dipeptidyl aminopeptidase/acylaminoacyl peptidase
MTKGTAVLAIAMLTGAILTAAETSNLSGAQATPAVQAPQTAQPPPPATEIYLAPFTDGPPKLVRLAILSFQSENVKAGDPINITNNPGYDNQPAFLPDSSGLLFASGRDGNQTDIYRYDIASKKTTQLTHTDDNEYSPTLAPDKQTFSTVRGAEQRLWRFNLDGSDAGLVHAHAGKIGYHAWLSPTQLATFILAEAAGKPNTLQVVDLATGGAEVVDSGIGRSLQMRPDGRVLAYVRKPQKEVWEIRTWDPTTRKSTYVVSTVEDSEDLAWTPGNRIVMGALSKLYFWREANDDRWLEFANLSKAGITAITRVAVSPDGKWIAIVSTPEKNVARLSARRATRALPGPGCSARDRCCRRSSSRTPRRSTPATSAILDDSASRWSRTPPTHPPSSRPGLAHRRRRRSSPRSDRCSRRRTAARRSGTRAAGRLAQASATGTSRGTPARSFARP